MLGGPILFLRVGLIDGVMFEFQLGDSLGAAKISCEGGAVSLEVGPFVGVIVRISLGDVVGRVEFSDGDCEISNDGEPDGEAVGFTLGDGLGSAVAVAITGLAVTSPA